MSKTKKCSICGRKFTGYGNNAYPINKGKCCDNCNFLFVIPKRIEEIQERKIANE